MLLIDVIDTTATKNPSVNILFLSKKQNWSSKYSMSKNSMNDYDQGLYGHVFYSLKMRYERI